MRFEQTAFADELLLDYRHGLAESLGRSGRNIRRMGMGLAALGAAEVVTDEDGVAVWSDLHLGHTNVIGYEQRPFASVDEMNDALWGAWLSAAAVHTSVICLGDVALSGCLQESTWARIRTIPGEQVLVLGNHDLTSNGTLRTQGFNAVFGLLVSVGSPNLIWTHAQLTVVPPGCVNLHGHLHRTEGRPGRYINLSVEQLGYRPVALPRVRALAEDLVRKKTPAGSTTLERICSLEGVPRTA